MISLMRWPANFARAPRAGSSMMERVPHAGKEKQDSPHQPAIRQKNSHGESSRATKKRRRGTWMLFAPEKCVDDVTAIQLADREQVHSCSQQADPCRLSHGVKRYIAIAVATPGNTAISNRRNNNGVPSTKSPWWTIPGTT